MTIPSSPTIYPTVSNPARGVSRSIPLYAPGGSRIPNLLIRSQKITQTDVVAGQRLSYEGEYRRRTDSATAGTVNAVKSHGLSHGFLTGVLHPLLRSILTASSSAEWQSASDRLSVDQQLDAWRICA